MERYLEITSKMMRRKIDTEQKFDDAVTESFKKVFPVGYEEGWSGNSKAGHAFSSQEEKARDFVKSVEEAKFMMNLNGDWLNDPEWTPMNDIAKAHPEVVKCVDIRDLKLVCTQAQKPDKEFQIDFWHLVKTDPDTCETVEDLGWKVWGVNNVPM